MTLRSRGANRVTTGRLPLIWRGSVAASELPEGPAVPHGTQGRVFVSWRIFSALIVVGLLAVLFMFFAADAFYVRSIAVGGVRYMTKEEIFALSDVANMHVFWVDPQAVRQSILRSPTLADAQVYVGWPPQMIQIVVQEREPALVWEQAGVATWVDLQGRVMRQWEDRPDLLRVTALNLVDGPLTADMRVNPDVVSGALQLHSLLPDRAVLRYHADKGLGFQDTGGWYAWFGIGTDMPEKLLIYNAIVANLQSRGVQPTEINTVNPDAPFYCGGVGGCGGQ